MYIYLTGVTGQKGDRGMSSFYNALFVVVQSLSINVTYMLLIFLICKTNTTQQKVSEN